MATASSSSAASRTGLLAVASECKNDGEDNGDVLMELVRLSMQLRFARRDHPREERLEMLQKIQRRTRQTARALLEEVAEPVVGEKSKQGHDSIDDLLNVATSPPQAFFAFQGAGRMHLPLIDWSTFRGYSMALWISVDHCVVAPRTSSGKSIFQLFKFTNASGTLGVEANLEFDMGNNEDTALLTVRSCAPHSAEQKRSPFAHAVVAAIAPATSSTPSEWRAVTHRVQLRKREWHLIVISHSLHYVKKSRVTCYVDAQQQFSEELVYPSGLVHASKSTIGGGSNVSVSLASATMYHEELQASIVESIYAHGPSVALFRRWMTVPSGSAAHHMVDLRDSAVLSPFRAPMEDAVSRLAELTKLQVVFAFTATDDGTEDDAVNGTYADRSIEWIAEGVLGSKGKWVALENVNATSEIQQRNARLGKNVVKQNTAKREMKTLWYRLLGVEAVPVLLDYVLTAAEDLMRGYTSDDGSITRDESELQATVEGFTADMLCILRGVLLNHISNIHQTLRNYVLHQAYHVMRRHPSATVMAWTPSNIVLCVDMIKNMAKMVPWSSIEKRNLHHPTQPSIWSWNPLFASAVRVWLLDYRVWTLLSYKTQSIYHHQLYTLACGYPKVLNDLNIVTRLLDMLQVYFSSSPAKTAGASGGEASSTSQNSNSSASDVEKEQHWKQRCIHTIIETMEVCLVNQSVHTHEALEQEVLETTFARASAAVPTPSSTPGLAVPSSASSAASGNPATSNGGDGGNGRGSNSSIAFTQQRRKGGVFFVNLENIIWSDQSAAIPQPEHRGHLSSEDKISEPFPAATSVLPHVQIRFSLLRDLRSIVRFLVVCEEPSVCTELLTLLRRLSGAYLDMRFGLVSSNLVDGLLRLLGRSFAKPTRSSSTGSTNGQSQSIASAVEVKMACVPLLIYLLDWLESVEGRTVWCGLEEHLRSILNGEGTYTRGFLELMMEFYFDPVALLGVQQSVLMNDPTKKDSVLFPISPIHTSGSRGAKAAHESGIVVMADDGLRSETMNLGDGDHMAGGVPGGGHAAWIKLATSFCGRKLSLSWEKRVQIVRMAALRSLTSPLSGIGTGTGAGGASPSQSPPRARTAGTVNPRASGGSAVEVTAMYDKGVTSILSLPLKSILPFLPVLLSRTSLDTRDRVLMEISVQLKTDDAHHDHQILMMKKDWIESFLELCVVCSSSSREESLGQLQDGVDPAKRTAATCSFDAHRTGEDLVVDAIVSILCGAMQHPRGWRTFIDLLAALQTMQRKYSSPHHADGLAASSSSIPAVLMTTSDQSAPSIHRKLALLAHPLDWLARVAGIVLQKMARSRTILSKVLTENVHKLLVLVDEALLSMPHQHCPATTDSKRASGSHVWSVAQVFLLNAVLDMCARLVESTHKTYRSGLVPGLQILQRSLSYVPVASGAALVERILLLLERAFQQEMNVASAVRVYDHLTPREVFLSALVCLRRALLVQQGNSGGHDESEICGALQLLILKLCTSEVFLEDLHAQALTVHDLSEMSEGGAAAALLDALGAIMNEAEMHEREEEADLVPLFPIAKELRLDAGGQASVETKEDLGPDPFAIAFSVGGSKPPLTLAISERGIDDSNTRSLWAALEVEENRMLETLKDVASRERTRFTQIKDVVVPQRDLWTKRLYDTQEFGFRSQHAYHVLSPMVAKKILQEYGKRVGLYEAAAPGRLRKPLDVDFPVSGSCVVEKPMDPSEMRRRRFSLPLEAHGLSEAKAAATKKKNKEKEKKREDDDQQRDGEEADPDSIDKESHLLLERVGRVIAQQGGGEIRDITSEASSSGSSPAKQGLHGEANQPQEEAAGSPSKNDQEQPHSSMDGEEQDRQQDDEDEDAYGAHHHEREEEAGPIARATTAAAPTAPLPSTLWYVDLDRHHESGLDPSEGMALAPNEQILAQAKCRRVGPEGMVAGNLYFCSKVLVFVPIHSTPPPSETSSSSQSNTKESGNDETAPGLHRCWRWKYKYIAAAFLRRFRLRDSAMELFFKNGTTHFLDFPHVVKQQRNELARLLYSFLPRSVPKQWPGSRGATTSISSTTKAWQSRQLSNYEYLMALNTFAGRSFNDLTQYPVFPWVVRDFESEILDLHDPQSFRDLSKPIGALNAERLEEYWERYHSFDDPVIPKFLYGSHYSTCAGVVLFFLMRLQPFAQLHRKMQGGSFDLPDRLFNSINETWQMCNSQMSEVKELTPEFYSSPSFLKNINAFPFGKRHDQRQVDDVVLPPWANGSPEQFIKLHREALESEYVSQHLHEWVDLIFGFKQRGKAALKANNVFYYLTYYGVVDLDRVDDPFIRESMELQIAHFGQCPMQLFTAPHPKRSTPPPSSMGPLPVAVGTSTSTSGPTTSGQPATATSATAVIASPPPPLAPQPGNRSPVAAVALAAGIPTAAASTMRRPLASMFQDLSPHAQEQRQQWSPTIVVKPLATSAIRWVRVFPDRFLTVNELGVVELYNWKLVAKPQAIVPMAVDSSEILGSLSTPDTPVLPPPPHPHDLANEPPMATTSREDVGPSPKSVDTQEDGTVVVGESPLPPPPPPPPPSCPWLLEVTRDASPFDVVPRVPVFEAADSDQFFPITSTLNGRVLISGGAPNGSIQLRLLDHDNGHVVAKASVSGHDAAVTCLSVDRMSYHHQANYQYQYQSDGEELLVSGSKDTTLCVWRLSRTKPDLLFRPPRISSCPILVLRGHKRPLVDCHVNSYLNVVASCSAQDALVHFLHDDGMVAFQFHSHKDVHENSTFVQIAASSKGFVVALVRWNGPEKEEEEGNGKASLSSSACVVYNLAGVCVLKKTFPGQEIARLQLSSEGDLVILTMRQKGIIRLCRLEDFVVVQEYETATFVEAPICIASFGPDEATILAVTGHSDGSMVLHLLPDADGSVSLLSNLRRLFGVNSKLKMVKGTVQQAQNLAWTTLGNAKAVTSTARDIAGEAIGEAKSMVKGFMSYLRQGSNGAPNGQ